VQVKNKKGTIIFTGVRFQTNRLPSLFAIGSFDNFLIPTGPLFRFQYDFLSHDKNPLDGHRKIKKLLRGLEYVLHVQGTPLE
jgi:hypothetical protein